MRLRTVLPCLSALPAFAPVAHARTWAAALPMCSASDAPPTLATAWSFSPLLLPPLLLFALYLVGLARLWRRAGVGHGIPLAGACALGLGAAAFALALVWPLDAYGEWSLAAHMGQHMLLLALVPPLLLAGRPVAGIAHALPRGWSRRLHAWADPVHRWCADRLGMATVAHGAVMAVWHFPAAIAVALSHPLLHMLMHASFLLAGLWFWMAVWRRIREPQVGAGAGVVALAAMMMVMGFTGALLTFAPRVLYPVYALRAPQLGLDPLADQQLAGVLMWVPSCLPYLAGGIWLMLHGFRHLQRRQDAAATNRPPEAAP